MKKIFLLTLLLIQFKGYCQKFTVTELITLIECSDVEFYDVLINKDFKFEEQNKDWFIFSKSPTKVRRINSTKDFFIDFLDKKDVDFIKEQLDYSLIKCDISFKDGLLYTYRIGDFSSGKKVYTIFLNYNNDKREYSVTVFNFSLK